MEASLRDKLLLQHTTCIGSDNLLVAITRQQAFGMAGILLDQFERIVDVSKRDESIAPILECALHSKESVGSCYIVQRCLRAGADPRRRGKNGLTPMHLASRGVSTTIVRILLQHDSTLCQARDAYNWTPLQYATDSGEKEVVNLLDQRGVDVNALSGKTEIFTALS